MKLLFLCTACLFEIVLYAQNNIEIGYFANGNMGIGKIIPNQPAGATTYELPLSINALSHRIEIALTKKRQHQFVIGGEYGSIGVKWSYYSYPEKYAYDDVTARVVVNSTTLLDTFSTSLRELFAFQGYEIRKSSILKLSMMYKYLWNPQSKLQHKSIVSLGFMSVINKNHGGVSYPGTSFSNKHHNYYGEVFQWVEGLDSVKNLSRTS